MFLFFPLFGFWHEVFGPFCLLILSMFLFYVTGFINMYIVPVMQLFTWLCKSLGVCYVGFTELFKLFHFYCVFGGHIYCKLLWVPTSEGEKN